jgi:mannosyltransferase
MSPKGESAALDELEVIIPNLKKRYSGGTAVNRTIAPLIAERCRAAWFGLDRPQGIAPLGVGDLLRLRLRHPKRRPARIWHARRNTEMLLGLVLKQLGWRLKLIFNSAGQRRKSLYTDFLIARMDAVIATSETSASFLRRPAAVIHHGIDVETYLPPADRLAAFAATGLPGKYGIGTFGRVRRQKGVDLFVEAACRLLPKYPDFTAVVIGFVSVDNRLFVEGLKQRITAAGLSDRIRFLGELPIEEVPLWYQRISIYVFASRVEGFGLTMLEAMAAGDAVVATRAGSAETVIVDGETGMLAPIGDVDGLVQALEPLMRDPERIADIGARARARIVQDFSRDREVDEIVSIYRRLWEGESAP